MSSEHARQKRSGREAAAELAKQNHLFHESVPDTAGRVTHPPAAM